MNKKIIFLNNEIVFDEFSSIVLGRLVLQAQPDPRHGLLRLRHDLEPDPHWVREARLHLEAGAEGKAGELWVRVEQAARLPGVHGLQLRVIHGGADVDDGAGQQQVHTVPLVAAN